MINLGISIFKDNLIGALAKPEAWFHDSSSTQFPLIIGIGAIIAGIIAFITLRRASKK